MDKKGRGNVRGGDETKLAPQESEAGPGAGKGAVERTRMERASEIATKVKGKSGEAVKFAKSNRNFIVYSVLFLYNASVLTYALVKYKDFPSYEDYETKGDCEKQEIDHAVLKVAGFSLMSAMVLGVHMFFSDLLGKADAREELSNVTEIMKVLSNGCLGTTISGIIFLIFRYYVDHTFAIVVGVLLGSLLIFDFIKLAKDRKNPYAEIF